MKIVYLYPRTSFISQYDSDFLFGFFLSCLRNFFGIDFTNNLIKKFENYEPPFLLSNCFYFQNTQEGKILYFPKPLLVDFTNEIDTLDKYSNLKNIKKDKYVDFKSYSQLITGEISSKYYYMELMQREQSSSKHNLTQQVSVPHVQINRLTNSSEEEHFYHTEDIFIDKGGLFFLLDGDFSIIKPVLRFLNHYGLGADTSTGKGHFRVEYTDFEFPKVPEPNCYINLSSYYPTPEEIDYFKQNINYFSYEIEQKEGKVNTSLRSDIDFRKQKVNYLTPGSVLPIIKNKTYYGCMQNVLKLEDTLIKFNGFSLKIPAKL